MLTASSSWFGRRRPSSIRTSAMRSPKDLLLMVEERSRAAIKPVNTLQTLHNRAGPRQVPHNGVIDGLLNGFASGGVEWIATRHHHRATDEIERNEQTPKREVLRQHRRDLTIDIVILQRHVGELGAVNQRRQDLFQRISV